MPVRILCALLAGGAILLAFSKPQQRGKAVFLRRCSGCHSPDLNQEGPRLRGVYGRRAAGLPEFGYSEALRNADIRWDEASLDRWLRDPGAMVADTDMDFRLSDGDERKAVIAYLKTLGLKRPVIQAPMAGFQGSALAIAVCEAGALGSLPCATLSVEAMRSEMGAIRAATEKPFNVNFFCHTVPEPDANREAAWRKTLSRYYVEHGIEAHAGVAGGGRRPFDDDAAGVVDEFRPAVVSFHFGLPSAHLMERVKGSGARIFGSATTVAEACWLEAHGADAVIAQGIEAGGHRGMFLTEDLTTQTGVFALLPQVVSAVKLPVIAAGGIADATGVAAALSLGAAAVQIGTAFLLCPEATTSAVHRAALRSGAANHTAITNVFSGRPARGIMNRLMRELGPMSDGVPEFPLAAAALAPLRAEAEARGSGDFSPLWCGQNATGYREISAAGLLASIASV